jgi:hypothetical protein
MFILQLLLDIALISLVIMNNWSVVMTFGSDTWKVRFLWGLVAIVTSYLMVICVFIPGQVE